MPAGQQSSSEPKLGAWVRFRARARPSWLPPEVGLRVDAVEEAGARVKLTAFSRSGEPVVRVTRVSVDRLVAQEAPRWVRD
jgi:hypothetical protein